MPAYAPRETPPIRMDRTLLRPKGLYTKLPNTGKTMTPNTLLASVSLEMFRASIEAQLDAMAIAIPVAVSELKDQETANRLLQTYIGMILILRDIANDRNKNIQELAEKLGTQDTLEKMIRTWPTLKKTDEAG